MINVYVYILDTLADWEIGYVVSELHSGRYFKKDAPEVILKTVSCTREPIKTMGGMTIVPDCVIDDIELNENNVLLLPGADTWNEQKHAAILKKAEELWKAGGTVCAICGATVALANTGMLNHCAHTSNGVGFLDMFAPNYEGKKYYVDTPTVSDQNMITAGTYAALPWARQIIEHLGVFKEDTLEQWYEFFRTGDQKYFFALMQSINFN